MIGILNYGLGNIQAFANIYKRLNINYKIIQSNKDFTNVTKLILPGVGSFDYAISALTNSGLRDKLEKLVIVDEIPILGVCVGLQMFAESSQEGSLNGLGWIKGTVKKIPLNNENKNLRLPHMGWNSINIISDNSLLKNIQNKSIFYFLHSFYFECNSTKNIIAESCYGINFPSIIYYKNIFGFQGHPEKSHSNGITILKNFDML